LSLIAADGADVDLLKLDVRSRVHAVIAAYELGVIQPGDGDSARRSSR
jgi:hypothetical protein